MEEPSLKERMAEKYDNRPIVRGLVQLIPAGIGSALETAFLTHATNLREQRVERLFKGLADGQLSLTDETVKNDEFVHKFVVTINASARTNRAEKIDIFANFFRNGSSPKVNTDEFDELLLVLDELSIRELQVLEMLDRYETSKVRVAGENDLQHSTHFWQDFKAEVIQKLGIPADSFDGFMMRLVRTGTYETFSGGYLGYAGGQGKITGIYRRLKELCSASSTIVDG